MENMVFKVIREGVVFSRDWVLEKHFTDLRGRYSTLKVFRSGEPSDYTGPRKADGIISYMVK